MPKAFVALSGEAHARRRSWPSSPSAWRPTSGCARVEFIDEIPKSPSGKILRRVLNERGS